MMDDMYILYAGGIVVPEPDPIKWAMAFGKTDRRIASTEIDGARISTVFIGLDHSFGDGAPMLFETIVFGGPLDGEQRRYSTREQAECGHNEIVGHLTRDALRKQGRIAHD